MQRLRVAPVLPPATAFSTAQVEAAASQARLAVARSSDADARPVEVAATPFLFGAPAGVAFMAAAAPRALALGSPAAQCPGVGVAAGDDGAPARALRRCLLDMTGAVETGPDDGAAVACGCALVALNDVILAPDRALDHAAAVGGRLLGAGVGAGGPLTVVEAPGPGGATVVEFRTAGGPVARGLLTPDGAASLTVSPGGRRFDGVRMRRGWRRGRIVERLLLRDADGERMIALIGFEPADVAQEGAALADWPRGLL